MSLATSYENVQDWKAHKRNGLSGGDDFAVPANGAVRFAIYGVVESGVDPLIIKRDKGGKTRVRHLGSVVVKKGDVITPDTILGYAQGRGGKSPHIEDVNKIGIRVQHVPDAIKIIPVAENVSVITIGEDEMKPIFLGLNRISWPCGYINSYDPNVYNAIKLVIEKGDREESRVQTYIRESWAAIDYMNMRAAAAAKKL